ncbi:hypothetical protein FRC09_020684 [Ceratobasidium sp. 395]|nr:hypothetical protein FRC09_020684 [Ceratobasidium sp. 395]
MLDRIKGRIRRAKEKSRRLFTGREPVGLVYQAPSISSQERAQANPSSPQPTAAVISHSYDIGQSVQIGLTPAVSVLTRMQSTSLSGPEPGEVNFASARVPTAVPPTLEATNPSKPTFSTASGLQDRKVREMDHVAWSGLKTLLGVLNRSADAFGPLKSAFDGFSRCIEIFEVQDQNVAAAREEYTQLKTELDSIFSDISGFLSGNAPPSMTPSIEILARGIEKEIERVVHKLRRGKMGQYAQATEDEYEVLECYRRIQVLLNRLSLNANTNIWWIIDEQATWMQIIERTWLSQQNRLNRLPHSAEAKYRSAQSERLGRNGCTPDTRVDVLKRLRAWTLDDKNQRIYWLNGMAGTGKTTIAYSLCEELQGAGKLAASFFCSRQLPSCRDVNRILPSIAYQLTSLSRPFRHELSGVLERLPDAHNQTIDLQFDSLVAIPLRAVRQALPVELVIVIDALDECEDSDGAGKMLLALLQHTLELPMKIFVTSRPDQQILDRMESEKYKHLRSELRLHELKHSEVQKDIRTYLTVSLDGVVLSAAGLEDLIIQSGVLFIYASTIVRYLTYDPARSGERLKKLLSMSASSGLGEQGIDKLYATILQAALDNKNLDSEEQRQVNQVLRTVICAQEPLPVDTIASLLGTGGAGLVRAALRPLSSILQVSNTTDQLVTTLHQSFPDYMLDQRRSGRYYCQPKEHNIWYAQTCFNIIESINPSFNICRIESSYVPDREIRDLADGIDKAIPLQLFYACRYWEAHAELVEPSKVVDQILCFLSTRFLLWMEIMSLKQSLSDGVGMLLRLQAWLLASSKIQEVAVDALRFITAYASSPTSQLTPHIYLSTLVLWPKQRPFSKLYLGSFPKLAEASGTAIDRQGAAALAVLNVPGEVFTVACSPDGATIAAGSSDHLIHIWDAYTGRTVGKPLEGHTNDVRCVAYSPDSRYIASSSNDKTIRIWDAKTGQISGQPWEGHTGTVHSVSFSPDGASLVSSSEDRTIRIWNARTGKPLGYSLNGHTEAVFSAVHSPNSACIISSSADKSLRIWDICTRQLIGQPLLGHTNYVRSVAYSPSGAYIVSGSSDETIRIWASETGQVVGESLKGHTGFVRSVACSRDDMYVVSGSDDTTICIWDTRTGRMVGQPLRGHTGRVHSVAFSPDGLRIISGSDDKTIRIWDAHIGHTLSQSPEGHTGAVCSVAYSSDGAHIASGSEDHTICIWDAYTRRMVGQPLKGHTGAVNSVAYSHNEKRIVSGSNDKTVRIWDVSSGQMVGQPLEEHTDRVYSVAFSPDGSRIASGSRDKTICIWDAHTGQMVGQPLKGHAGTVYSVAFSPDGTCIASGSYDKTLCIWDASTGEMAGQPLTGHTDEINAVAYSPSGNHIVSGSDDKTVCVWDARTGQIVGQPLKGHTDLVRSVAYSPDGARIVSGSNDKTIRIWDAQAGQILGQPLEGHTSNVRSVAYSPDGKHIVSGSSDKSIRIWGVCTLSNSGKAPQIDSCPANQSSCSSDTPVRIPDDSDHRSPVYEPRTQCGLPIHRNPSDPNAWTLSEDGWVVGHDLKPLLWVPPELRDNLLRYGNEAMISTEGSWSLDFSRAKLGADWQQCYRP